MNLTKQELAWCVATALLAIFGWRPICWVALKLMGAI